MCDTAPSAPLGMGGKFNQAQTTQVRCHAHPSAAQTPAFRCPFSVPAACCDALPELKEQVMSPVHRVASPELSLKHCQPGHREVKPLPRRPEGERPLLKPLEAEFLPTNMHFAHSWPRQPRAQLCSRHSGKHQRGRPEAGGQQEASSSGWRCCGMKGGIHGAGQC